MKLVKFAVVAAALFSLTGCMTESKLRDALKNDPTILTDAIKAHPTEFLEGLQAAAEAAKRDQAKMQMKRMEDEMNAAIENPLVPVIRDDETIRGDKNAPIIIVEYSDFECPYCSRGFQTVNQLKTKYGKDLQFIYKHLPLNFHQFAMPAAQFYEAVRLQSAEAAFKVHDKFYSEPQFTRGGEKEWMKYAKTLKLNVAKIKKDMQSDAVAKRIADDMAEAQKFGMNGTPGFLVNGVPVRGAYPADHFIKIVDLLKSKGKLKL